MWFRLFGLMLWMFHVAAQTPEGEFTVVSDIQYCTGGGRPLLMDVFVPKHRNRTPTASGTLDSRRRLGARGQERQFRLAKGLQQGPGRVGVLRSI